MFAAGVVTAAAVAGRETAPGRAVRRGVEELARRLRYTQGRLEGVRYRLAGRIPDPEVSDDVLADRIRSSLGRLEKRLDVPRIHVVAEDHIAILHGEVPEARDAATIERAVTDMSGVRGVESYLHIGLDTGGTRPSEGRALAKRVASPALRQLMDAAGNAGATEDRARGAVRAVLAVFADRIPADERNQLFAHVPEDVRELAAVPRRHGEHATSPRTVSELVAAIGSHDRVDPVNAEAITEAVLARLRELVPEEADDVAAVLPEELRDLWITAVAS